MGQQLGAESVEQTDRLISLVGTVKSAALLPDDPG